MTATTPPPSTSQPESPRPGPALPGPTATIDGDVVEAVRAALGRVDDPEYPGISIVDLGMVESVSVDGGRAVIGLVPTFSGCPALAVIAEDVEREIATLAGVAEVEVTWLPTPRWTVDRVSERARLDMARQFTVAVRIGAEPARCPRCGQATVEQSMFGPSRCRAVHRCPACSETVEVMRS